MAKRTPHRTCRRCKESKAANRPYPDGVEGWQDKKMKIGGQTLQGYERDWIGFDEPEYGDPPPLD